MLWDGRDPTAHPVPLAAGMERWMMDIRNSGQKVPCHPEEKHFLSASVKSGIFSGWWCWVPIPTPLAPAHSWICSGSEGTAGSQWIKMGSQWDHSGITSGSQWDHNEIKMGSQWDHEGITSGSLWSHSGSQWDHTGFTPGSQWDHNAWLPQPKHCIVLSKQSSCSQSLDASCTNGAA